MNNEKNVDTLIEVVRNQQSMISEMQCALKVSSFEQDKKDNTIKELERLIKSFVDEFQINESWEAFKNNRDKLIADVMGEYMGEYNHE